jgi:hypothetical protein
VRTAKAWGVTERSTTFVRFRSDFRGRAMTDTPSHEASGRPSASSAALTCWRIARRGSISTIEVTSELEPRLTIIALSSRPVPRRAVAKPCDMAVRITNTATTSAMPATARSATVHRSLTLRML